ncbi:Pr6Pr family membrane protein [Pseudomonas sp. Pf153]|uniref:Pr6Pr family membrane protein n=1 Tax=Pseudomonas sp. Pf153 TaxID=1699309 RepID=UPI00069DE35D|nr:Pr6Pr family membrane protein [Pseudomonas sp. Pf153]
MSDDMALTQRRGNATVMLAAVLAWFALFLQLCLIMISRWQGDKSLLGGLDIFFSYFTILTNILVAVVLTCAATTGDSALRRFFLQPSTQGGVAAAIVLVSIAYNLLLRNVWDPQGWQWLADELLHDVMPVVFVVYWWFCVPKGLHWSNIWPWLLYPLAYFSYVLIRGSFVGAYPYPFIEVDLLGYAQSIGNAAMMLLGFVVVSLVVVAVDRVKGGR